MYCPKCGAENAEGSQLCSACSWVLTSRSTGPLPDAKTSGLAITSLVLGILSIFCSIFTAIPAIIFGIVALVKIGKSSGRLKGSGLAIGGIATPVATLPIMAILLAILIPAMGQVREKAQQVVCISNMKGLAMATMIYANDYDDSFPTANQWCDLLISEADVSEKSFYCKEQPDGSFSYGFNKNLDGLKISDVGQNTVMIFESDGDRNATGGPEMLAAERHEGRGCNIVFVDGHVEFVRTEDFGNLKWTVDKWEY